MQTPSSFTSTQAPFASIHYNPNFKFLRNLPFKPTHAPPTNPPSLPPTRRPPTPSPRANLAGVMPIRFLYISMSIPALNQIFAVEDVYLRYCSSFEEIFVALSVFA
jgi:hypothetical protein